MNRLKYRPEYCQQLVEHLGQGNSFKSFGGVIDVSKRTLENWEERFPAFKEARAVGLAKGELYMLNVGKLMMTGQLKRIVSEEPIINPNGLPVFDKKGNPLMRRTFAPVKGDAAVWIFKMRNIHKWSNTDTVRHAGPGPGEQPVQVDARAHAMSDEEMESRLERYAKLRSLAKEEVPDGSGDRQHPPKKRAPRKS